MTSRPQSYPLLRLVRVELELSKLLGHLPVGFCPFRFADPNDISERTPLGDVLSEIE